MLWELRSKEPKIEAVESMELVPLTRVNLPLDREQWVVTLAWSPDGSRLAVGAFGTGDVWLMDRQGQPLGTLRGHTETVWRTSFSAKGILATSSSDATTRLWEQDGTPVAALISASPEQDPLIDVVAWSPAGNLLAVASPNEVICLYSNDAVPKARLAGHSGMIEAIDWHPDGKRLASADDDRVTHLWNLPSLLD
jgi:WD40 repeat protein